MSNMERHTDKKNVAFEFVPKGKHGDCIQILCIGQCPFQ